MGFWATKLSVPSLRYMEVMPIQSFDSLRASYIILCPVPTSLRSKDSSIYTIASSFESILFVTQNYRFLKLLWLAKRTHEYSQIKVYPEMTPSGVYSDPREVLIKKKPRNGSRIWFNKISIKCRSEPFWIYVLSTSVAQRKQIWTTYL